MFISDLTSAEVSTLYSSIQSSLFSKESSVNVNVANRFFIDKEFMLDPDYQSHIEKDFTAGAENIDFSKLKESAEYVNYFVNKNTCGMIPHLVEPDDFYEAAFVLINAVYFKGAWAFPFRKEKTKTMVFKGVTGERNEEFMFRNIQFARQFEGRNLTIVSLPFNDRAYSLVIFMPSGDFGEWRDKLTAEELHGAMEKQYIWDIDLRMPKFKIDSTTDGIETLKKCGVKKLFGREANLSGIFYNPVPEFSTQRLHVSKIVHKTVFEMDEYGATAAGATAIFGRFLSGGGTITNITIDRPFLYAIVKDDANILFLGQHV